MKHLLLNTKICETCGGVMIRPRWANGKLDATFAKRRFCSPLCFGVSQRKETATANTGRRRAQRLYAASPCSICGSTTKIQRHHVDGNPLNNHPDNIMVICQPCHIRRHNHEKTWGKGQVQEARCQICQTIFQPKRSRNNTICQNSACLSELGRRASRKRWFRE